MLGVDKSQVPVDTPQYLFKKEVVAGHGVARAYCDYKPIPALTVNGNSVGQWRGVGR